MFRSVPVFLVLVHAQLNLLKVFGVSLEMSSDPKKYIGFLLEFGDNFCLPGI